MAQDTGRMREALRSVPFLSTLDDVHCDTLGSALRRREVAAGAEVFRQGQPGDSMLILVSGRLRVQIAGDVGPAVTVATVYPGEVVGEMACVDPAPRSATVLAADASEVLELDRTTLQAMIAHAPAVSVAVVGGIIGLLTRRIRETNARIEAELERRGLTPSAPPPAPPVATQQSVDSGPVDLRRVPCVAHFSDDQLRTLVRVAPPRTWPAGSYLCREGHAGGSCFILARGAVQVIRRISGQDRVLATLQTGAVVGQMALVDRSPRSATVRVQEPTVVLELRSEVFGKLLASAHPLGARFQEQIAVAGIRQLRTATRRLRKLMTERERAAAARPAKRPGPVKEKSAPRPPSPPVAGPEDDVLAYMQAALGEWDMDVDDLDAVQVRRVDGQMSAAEAKMRKR